MATYTSNLGAGAFIASEAAFWRSRDHATLITGQNLVQGTVLGRITASGKLTGHAPGASDGSQNAMAVLLADTNATSADTRVVVLARDCEVDGAVLTWAAGISGPQKVTATAALLALGIVVR